MKKKDIKVILFGIICGIITWFILDLIWDRERNVDDFKNGVNAANGSRTESIE